MQWRTWDKKKSRMTMQSQAQISLTTRMTITPIISENNFRQLQLFSDRTKTNSI